jgi:twitching motility protein PilT
MEIMLAVPAVGNLIRESKTYQLTNVIQTNANLGMQTRDQALRSLFERGLITFEAALAYATSQDDLRRMTRRIA